MIPFANDTITLYHRTETTNAAGKTQATWNCFVIPGCSFRRRSLLKLADGSSIRAEETVCRIPSGNQMPTAGDLIILGEIPDRPTSAIGVDNLLDKHKDSGAFRVVSVSDNSRPGMPIPHYAARG